MTLNTDSRKVKKPMNGLDFQIAMVLNLLGIDQVHEKLLPELKLRTTLAKASITNVISDELIWEDFLGFKTKPAFYGAHEYKPLNPATNLRQCPIG